VTPTADTGRSTTDDAVLFTVMASRMDGICREMANTLMHTARSSVLALAHDFSCAIVSGENDLLAAADGLPIQLVGAAQAAETMTSRHPELTVGDAFLHNDVYSGNTHAGDFTILVPVFFGGRHVFTTVVRGHQADIGNALPTTYMANARDVYEEGALVFPCVKVQSAYGDVDDVIRLCYSRIRSPEVWYGDYLAMLGAARVGERALTGLCDKYGAETVDAFVDWWLDYGERRMTRAIGELRSGTWRGRTAHDAVAGVDEIPLEVAVTVDADAGRVEIDLRNNPDCIPAGLNQTETTATSSALIGLLNCLDPTVPKNAGSLRRVDVLLRENCVAGIPRFPACCSVATTNIADRIINMTQTAIAQMGAGFGLAEGAVGLGPDRPNVSGKDARAGDRDYAVQLFIGTQGGPAAAQTDGWLAYVLPVAAGVLHKNSVEATEHKVPIVITENRVRTDGEGPGRHRGAAGNELVYGPLGGPMDVYYVLDGVANPPRGVQGGHDGVGPQVHRVTAEGERVDETHRPGHLPLAEGELLVAMSCGGAGYGDPVERDPELVLHDVRERYITVERAATVYRVAIEGDPARSETLRIAPEETERLRAGAQ
jgi:N-methylhydantoinase B